MELSSLQTCSQLNEDIFAEFSTTREHAYALLDRVAEISQPHDGIEKVISFLARIALGNSWVDGGLRVDVRHTGMFKCQLKLMRDLGGDEFEVLKKIGLSASYLEFKEAGKNPQDILPFTMDEKAFGPDKLLTFTAPEAVRRSTKPPPAFLEAQACVLERQQRWTQPFVPVIESPEQALPKLRPELQAALDKRRKQNASRPTGAGGYSIVAAPTPETRRSAQPLSRIATIRKPAADVASISPQPAPLPELRPKSEAEGIDDGWDDD